MSHGLFRRPGLAVTSFCGGVDRGPCLQFTTSPFAQLDALDVKALAFVLDGWLRQQEGDAPKEGAS